MQGPDKKLASVQADDPINFLQLIAKADNGSTEVCIVCHIIAIIMKTFPMGMGGEGCTRMSYFRFLPEY